MGRPRKSEHDDLYNEDALNHDLTPEEIRERSLAQDDALAVDDAARIVDERDPDAEEPLIEIGEREDGGYFDSLRDDDSEDDQ
jgi:hypothetical protein